MLKKNKSPYNLAGKFLVAMPHMKDLRFAKSVIFICGHDENGAMGLVINQVAEGLMLKELLSQLGMTIPAHTPDHRIAQGGPIEIGRGFVLHSPDYSEDSTIHVQDDFALTATTDILHNIAAGKGPRKAFVVLGYSGWSAGQLEKELESNDWLQLESDSKIIFETPFEQRWYKVLAQVGIDPAMLSDDAGHS